MLFNNYNFMITKINFDYFKSDLLSGITAAVVALPLGLAFGVSSGLGALAGLYGAIFVGFFASLFGGTPKQISGPTGPMTVIVALIFIEFNFKIEIVFLCISLAGLMQIIFGLLKLGNLIKKIPKSVISGFMTGIGLIIISLQVPIILGLGPQSTIIQSLMKLGEINNINYESLIIGSLCFFILFFSPSKIFKNIPISIIVLLFGTLLSIMFFTKQDTIGFIPKGLPNFNLYIPDLLMMPKILFYSLLLSLLGIIDSLLTSVISDQLTGENHKPNKESIGQGIGNFVSGLFGGLAGAGATMRTVVNIKAGGKTSLSGMIHAITLLIIVLYASPLAEAIPLSVLAAILIKVGIDIIDWNFIKNYKTKSFNSITTKLLVVILTVFTNLIGAVLIGTIYNLLIKFYLKKIKKE